MVEIRAMAPADLEEVLGIAAASPGAASWSRQAYEAMLEAPERGCCRVAEQSGTVIGFACFRIVGEEAELLNLAVAPSARRKGIGGQLVEQAMREAGQRGARRIFLEVRDTNVAALRLYERLGFTVSGRRPGYYSEPPGDALVLARELSRG